MALANREGLFLALAQRAGFAKYGPQSIESGSTAGNQRATFVVLSSRKNEFVNNSGYPIPDVGQPMNTNFKTISSPATSLVLLITLVVTTGCLGTSIETTVGATENETTDAPDAPAAPAAATDELPPFETIEVSTEEPTATDVVKLGSATKPGAVAAGGVVMIAVRVRVAEPWHIYAVNKPTGVSVPTKLKLKLPEGVTAVGEWDIPKPKEYEDDVFVYEKDVIFRRYVKVADSATGSLNIGCEVKYQPCNDQSCKPPTTGTTSVAVKVAE